MCVAVEDTNEGFGSAKCIVAWCSDVTMQSVCRLQKGGERGRTCQCSSRPAGDMPERHHSTVYIKHQASGLSISYCALGWSESAPRPE